VALTSGAQTLAIAVPSAEAALIRDLRDRADRAGLKVLVLPPISEIFGGLPKPADLRDVDLNDLLGRRAVSMDTGVISEQLAGKVILVTGAGGPSARSCVARSSGSGRASSISSTGMSRACKQRS